MKHKKFNDIELMWDRSQITIKDSYNSFRINMDYNMRKYFIPCIERLCKICSGMGADYILTSRHSQRGVVWEEICVKTLDEYRKYGNINGNYMDINRKDLILSCFAKCFKTKQIDIPSIEIPVDNLGTRELLCIMKGEL